MTIMEIAPLFWWKSKEYNTNFLFEQRKMWFIVCSFLFIDVIRSRSIWKLTQLASKLESQRNAKIAENNITVLSLWAYLFLHWSITVNIAMGTCTSVCSAAYCFKIVFVFASLAQCVCVCVCFTLLALYCLISYEILLCFCGFSNLDERKTRKRKTAKKTHFFFLYFIHINRLYTLLREKTHIDL